jgi:hypothetical protein
VGRLDLPEGEWAELADPRKVTERKRRPYVTAMSAFNEIAVRDAEGVLVPSAFGEEQQRRLDTALDLLTVALVKAWSFEQGPGAPLPIAVESLQDLPVDCFDELRRAVGEISAVLLPNFSPTPDPKAPTAG